MATVDGADAPPDVDAAAQSLLAAYRRALGPDSRRLGWLPRSLLVHMVARGSRVASNRLVVTTEAPSAERLKLFADEAARADPFARLTTIPRVLVHAGPYVALPVALAASLWCLGQRINAYPGNAGLVSGSFFFVVVASAIVKGAFEYVTAQVAPAYALLKEEVNDWEQQLFAALKHPVRRRLLGKALPLVWSMLWLVLLGLVVAGFIVGHWGGRGPRSTGDDFPSGSGLSSSWSTPGDRVVPIIALSRPSPSPSPTPTVPSRV